MSAVAASRAATPRKRHFRLSEFLLDKVLVCTLIILFLLFALFPFLWMFSPSIKPETEAFAIPPR